MSEVLYRKYRPAKWEDVLGQSAVVGAFSRAIKERRTQSFILTGPSGVGKTTLARIGARALGAADKDIVELDAATHTGVDDMRAIKESLHYMPFGASKHRSLIIDEAHALSKSAWNSLLKAIEEPPEHVSWFFCTTESGKIPATIKTRCASFNLKELNERDLSSLMKRVCAAEKIKFIDGVEPVVLRMANGSPRQLLVNVELCRTAKSRAEAIELLQTADENGDGVIELCRFLIANGGSWARAMAILAKIEGSAEGVRIVVCNYVAVVLRNAKTDKEACRLLGILEAFGTPYITEEKMTPLYRSIGQTLFS